MRPHHHQMHNLGQLAVHADLAVHFVHFVQHVHSAHVQHVHLAMHCGLVGAAMAQQRGCCCRPSLGAKDVLQVVVDMTP